MSIEDEVRKLVDGGGDEEFDAIVAFILASEALIPPVGQMLEVLQTYGEALARTMGLGGPAHVEAMQSSMDTMMLVFSAETRAQEQYVRTGELNERMFPG